MKKILFLTVVLIVVSATILFGQITIKQADNVVYEYLKKDKIVSDYWLYANDSVLSNKTKVETLVDEILSPDYPCWVYFVDEQPFVNWSHKCQYLFVNKETGDILTKSESFPPNDIANWRMITNRPELPIGKKFAFQNSPHVLKSGLVPQNCYAVIISGGANAYYNWIRYWNDCSAIYSALVNVYGYLDDHIYVLISDGTDPGDDRHHYDLTYDSSPLDLDGDGDDDIQYAATKNNITTVFNILSNILDEDDYLFIFTTDHGGQHSGDDVYINLWGETMNDDEFAAEVNKVNAGHISIVMEQCHSGGFINDLSGTGRTIATACKANESSYAMPPDYLYNEFVYHWTAAVAGEDPYGNPIDADNNNDGFVSMKEAFDYAVYHDAIPYETPQYYSNKHTLGENLTLLGKELCVSTDYIVNLTINTDQTIIDCEIVIAGVTIDNNSNVIFEAEKETYILDDFEVKIGSTLEVK